MVGTCCSVNHANNEGNILTIRSESHTFIRSLAKLVRFGLLTSHDMAGQKPEPDQLGYGCHAEISDLLDDSQIPKFRLLRLCGEF